MKLLFFGLLFLWLSFSKTVLAQEQFVTIVNPVRISAYTKNPKEALLAQYKEVRSRNLPATWLLTYDVLTNPDTKFDLLGFDSLQEIGVFLEVTPKLAGSAGVLYSKTDSWHRANAVFLSGYVQADRIKLIDTIFEEFKKNFGYYPKSVGAWWIDSFSLDYMKKKFDLAANLTVADQFSTDGYKLWGQYWSVPFYPSKYHAGMPARTVENKLDLVTIQWASRDPLNGYGRAGESTFSTQDYFTRNLSDDYFEKLVNLYTKQNGNKFGHITVGLEGDFTPEVYSGHFSRQLDLVKRRQDEGRIKAVTMKDFGKWYKDAFPRLSPPQIIQTDDLLGKRMKTFWYQSPAYRVNITYDYENKKAYVNDFRSYPSDFEEPYYFSPNRDLNLNINIPSMIDSAGSPEEKWLIVDQELKSTETQDNTLLLDFEKTKIWMEEEKITISGDINSLPANIKSSPYLQISKKGKDIELRPEIKWPYPREGYKFRDLTQEATFFLQTKKAKIALGLAVLALFMIPSFKFKALFFLSLAIFLGVNTKEYFVSQGELDGLFRLKWMDGKKIVVMDQRCLQCSWHTSAMPAIFANKRDYVRKITGKEIVYNLNVFDAKTREEGRSNLKKLNADYIYVVRFENYVETPPFSPGDLNLEEIYSNANATVWRIKKN